MIVSRYKDSHKNQPFLLLKSALWGVGLYVGFGLLFSSTASNAAPFQAQQSLTRAVNKCALISSASKRLQCFDRLTGRATTVLEKTVVANNPTVSMAASPTIKTRPLKTPNNPSAPLNSESNLKSANAPEVVSNAKAIRADKKRAFGKTSLTDEEREKEVNSVEVVFTSAQKNTMGKWVFKTDDGQTWKQTDSRFSSYPTVPFQAEIKKGFMSAFYMKPIDGSVSLKIKRMK